MAVYVDPLCDYGWRYGPSCHMVADTLDELHEMASAIGMKRTWFQTNSKVPHYDLTEKRRKVALEKGTLAISRKEFYTKFLRNGKGKDNKQVA